MGKAAQFSPISLIESGIAAQDRDSWNDFFAVFQKAAAPTPVPKGLIVDSLADCTNVRRFDRHGVQNQRARTEDWLKADKAIAALNELRCKAGDGGAENLGLQADLTHALEKKEAAERQLVTQSARIAELEQVVTEPLAQISALKAELELEREDKEHAERQLWAGWRQDF